MTELISVIVPVYNVCEFLEQCVESIRRQTWKNLEIILVDDGSTDESGSLCEKLAEEDDRITVIHQENQGAAGARNSGLDAAVGEYISIIDADDYIWSQMYEILWKSMQKADAQFACCPYQLVEKREPLTAEKAIAEPYPSQVLTRKEIYRHFYDYHTMWVIQPNKLYKKSLFEQYRFPKGHYYEDEYAAHHLMKNVERAVYVDIPFYRYYVREGSATRRGITSRQLFLLDALLDRIAYFKEENETDILPRTEECLFEAYRSISVGMIDRTKRSEADLRKIRKQYWKALQEPDVTAGLSKALKLKRRLYLIAPRIMEKAILFKNRKRLRK